MSLPNNQNSPSGPPVEGGRKSPALRLSVPRVSGLDKRGLSGRVDPQANQAAQGLMTELEALLMSQGCPVPIAQRNWPGTDAGVQCQAMIAHDGTQVYLYFAVQEPEVRAVVMDDQGPVYQDSCVEWFISPWRGTSMDPAGYRNFEFNAIGTCLHYLGPNRQDRTPQPSEVIDSILRIPSLGVQALGASGPREQGAFRWSLGIIIPGPVLGQEGDLSGSTWVGNFYKCGDGLSQPHYLSWSGIELAEPDFHCPEFFGKIDFS